MSGDESALVEALSVGLAQLANGGSFTAVELATAAVTVWTVSRNDAGTPELPRYNQLTAVPDTDRQALADFYAGKLAPLLRRRPLLIARPRSDYPVRLLSLLRSQHPVPVYEYVTPLSKHILSAIRTSPLRAGYELVVLREDYDGRLTMDLRQLFPQDDEAGSVVDFTVRCAPTDVAGTVFAIMVRDRAAGATPAAPRLRQIELQSAKIPPGEYTVTAELQRPDHVEFHGLPVPLARENRAWREIVRTVPWRLPRARPPHLVCMLEVSGPEHLEHRVERLDELINEAEASGPELRVSLVTYGPHSFERGVLEAPATVVAWAAPSDLVLRELSAVKRRVAPDKEYLRAAQVECALREVANRFTGRAPGRDGKPVLVTVGTRPPHPDRVDIQTEIIPCPYKVSWQRMFRHLCEALPGLKFGALCNTGAVGSVWSALGMDAIEEVEVADMSAFAAKLGLRDPVQAVPFPLV